MATARTKAAGPVTIQVDLSELAGMTGREIRAFERVQPGKMSNPGKVSEAGELPVDTLYAPPWVFYRRENPGVSLHDLPDVAFSSREGLGAATATGRGSARYPCSPGRYFGGRRRTRSASHTVSHGGLPRQAHHQTF